MRKVGRCIGNLCCPFNDCLFMVLADGKRKWSRSWEMTEYCRVSKVLTGHHLGIHTCPKQNMKKYKRIDREVVVRDSSVGECPMHQTEVGEAVLTHNISEACRRALQMSYSHIRSEKASLGHERIQNKHWLEAIGIFKKWLVRKTNMYFIKLKNHSSMMT